MADKGIPDFLQKEMEAINRKQTAAKAFAKQIKSFRQAAQTYRLAAEEVTREFADMSQKAIAEEWGLTGTEKSIAFDRKAELVLIPRPEKDGDASSQDDTRTADDNGTETMAGEQASSNGGQPVQADHPWSNNADSY